MKLKLNILFPFLIALTIWAGCTGRVPWWTIVLIIASHAEVNVVFRA